MPAARVWLLKLSAFSRRSADDLLNPRPALLDDADRPAVGHVLLVRVEAQRLDDGGHEVGHSDRVGLDRVTALARLAVGLPALDAAASQHRRPRRGPVVAALRLVDLRRAS